jgi:dTDP-4-amino-4,6-dideoxygalactose transaminase
MTLSIIPLQIPDLRGREREYLIQCVDDNWVSSAGPFVTELEERMAALCGCGHGVAMVNGTAAIHLALVAAGVGPGDYVAVPDWTFAASANAIYHAGATPFFVDVDARTWTLDPDLLARALEQVETPIKAVLCVHTLGHPADMDALLAVCQSAGVPMIEDAAGAVGAKYKGRNVGGDGLAACFSFNGNKLVTAGGGGMIVTNDEALAARARKLSTQSREGADYIHSAVAWNYRMTNVNAAIGLAQMERLDEMIAAKHAIAVRYDEALGERSEFTLMPRSDWIEHNGWLYSVALPDEESANSLIAHLRSQKIEARNFWRALSAQDPYAQAPTLLNGTAADLSGRVVSLPCSSHLSEADQDRVIKAISAWSCPGAVPQNHGREA